MTSSMNTVISLNGSAAIVSEFFGYAINSILYQRGIYDPESFRSIKKYGLSMQITTDDGLNAYLKNILLQLETWLETSSVKRLVIVVTSTDTEETIERWSFDVQTDKETINNAGHVSNKSESDIQKEIAAIIRQITSSVSFLPLLDTPCTFDLLVYTPSDLAASELWEESDPRYIAKANEVRLRSFTTKIHKVETSVAYKAI